MTKMSAKRGKAAWPCRNFGSTRGRGGNSVEDGKNDIGHESLVPPEHNAKYMYAPPPHLNLVVLRSADIDHGATFYREMGLLFTKHAHGSGPEHYSSEVSGLVFELYPLTAKSNPTTGTRIGFRVDSVDGVVGLLTKIGAVVVSPPTDSEWGRRAVVKDFDGHIIELVTPNGT